MTTRTQNRSSARSSSGNQSRSAFSWSDNAGPIIAAAIGGAALGFAANYGRKALMQGMEAAVGEWDEILATEHDVADLAHPPGVGVANAGIVGAAVAVGKEAVAGLLEQLPLCR